MKKKEFAAAVLDSEHKTYVVYVASLNFTPLVASLDVHPFWKPQISSLIAKEALIKVPAKYLDFANVFPPDLVSKLSKHIEINNHAIKLVDGC